MTMTRAGYTPMGSRRAVPVAQPPSPRTCSRPEGNNPHDHAEFSVQLYSVHEPLDADLDGTLARLADIGFATWRRSTSSAASSRSRRPSTATGSAPPPPTHPLEERWTTPDGLLTVTSPEQTFAAAAELGVSGPHRPLCARRTGGPPSTTSSAPPTRLNARAAQAAPHGLRVGYHNHDARAQLDDRRPAGAGGVRRPARPHGRCSRSTSTGPPPAASDPAALLRRLGDRVRPCTSRTARCAPASPPGSCRQDQCPAGQGDVPLAAALAAGSAIEYAVIEFDHYEGDIFDGLTQSYAFLRPTLGAEASE